MSDQQDLVELDAGDIATTTKADKLKSKRFVEKMAKTQEIRVEEALDPNHIVQKHYGYEVQRDLWQNSDERDRHAIVYGMVLIDGAIGKAMNDIARFFGLDKKDLVPYKDTFEMAKAALKLKIQRNQISIALQREDQPNFKFFLGKQFAEQVGEPAHEGVETTEGQAMKSIFDSLSVVETHRDENGNTIAEPTTLKLVQGK